MEDQINKTRYTTTNKKRRKILDQIKYHLTKKKEKKREEKFKSNNPSKFISILENFNFYSRLRLLKIPKNSNQTQL